MWFETISEIATLRDYRHPWQWAEDNIVIDKQSSIPGQFSANTAPWTKEIMEAFADDSIREMSLMCSAQSGKTQTMMILLAWAIAEDPGPAMWVLAAQDEAEDFMQTRLLPTLMECQTIKRMMPRERSGKRKGTIDFAPMTLMIRGAGSPSKLQSVPVRWLILDEVRNYPPGALEMVRKRVRAQWNYKIVQISTPLYENDAVHQSFLDGDQRRFEWPCEACGEFFCPLWEHIEWEESERTKTPEGKWLFEPLAETIRLKCPSCGHGHTDDPVTRRTLVEKGRWKKGNLIAPKHKVSFTWSSLVPWWISWREAVEEFIVAKRQMTFGNSIPMMTWKRETMGEPWVDDLSNGQFDIAVQASPYALRNPTGGRIFLTVDVQQTGVWWVAREWFFDGASRLVDFGFFTQLKQINEIIQKYSISPKDVMVDSGFETQTVYSEIVNNGAWWKATKGHDSANGYKVGNIRQAYQWSKADAMLGRGTKKVIGLLVFSNPLIKDTLAHLMSGKGPKWEFSIDAGDSYVAQITAERREERIDAHGRVSYIWRQIRKDNHLFDCEVLQVLGALVTKIIGGKQNDG